MFLNTRMSDRISQWIQVLQIIKSAAQWSEGYLHLFSLAKGQVWQRAYWGLRLHCLWEIKIHTTHQRIDRHQSAYGTDNFFTFSFYPFFYSPFFFLKYLRSSSLHPQPYFTSPKMSKYITKHIYLPFSVPALPTKRNTFPHCKITYAF